MQFVTILFVVLYTNYANAQAPDIEWQHRIGGFGWNGSYGSQPTSDGGFIVGGRSNSNASGDKSENSRGEYDYWIVKTDANGLPVWDKTVGGASPTSWEQDDFSALAQSSDGGYILCGASDSPLSGDKTENAIGGGDFWIVKITSTGTIEWQNVIGGNSSDVPYCIYELPDGNFLVGGYSQSGVSADKTEPNRGLQDYWILKLDPFGNILWQKTVGGAGIDLLSSIVISSDGYLLAGSSGSNVSGDKTENSRGGNDYWIVKLDLAGNIIWQKTVGGSGYDRLSEAKQTSDGGYFLAGFSLSPISGEKSEGSRGSYDYWVLKTNSSGEIEWQRTLGGSGDDSLFSADLCLDEGFILTGTTTSPISGEVAQGTNGEYDGWVVKLSAEGTILWQKTLGGLGSDGFNQVHQVVDGSYFLSGGTNSIISGDITEPPIGQRDYWIVKLVPDELGNDELATNSISLWPNPTSGEININVGQLTEGKIEVFNVVGQLLYKQDYFTSEVIQQTLPEADGIYFVTVSTFAGQSTFKIIKQ
jgi:hypothetical protein